MVGKAVAGLFSQFNISYPNLQTLNLYYSSKRKHLLDRRVDAFMQGTFRFR